MEELPSKNIKNNSFSAYQRTIYRLWESLPSNFYIQKEPADPLSDEIWAAMDELPSNFYGKN